MLLHLTGFLGVDFVKNRKYNLTYTTHHCMQMEWYVKHSKGYIKSRYIHHTHTHTHDIIQINCKLNN